MKRSIILAAAVASISAASWCGSASAQGVEIYVGPPTTYDPYYGYPANREYRHGPRVYGYARRSYEPDVEVEVDRPSRPGGCGTYRFWNGYECVDARYR
jgi:hypothetical protein